MTRVLILRPEPGASETAGRARALGLDALVAPLFTIRPLPWEPPQGPFDAILLTSANAPRQGGPELARFLHLPCLAVGEATAEAARAAGFENVDTGPADGAAALALGLKNRYARILHLCGRERVRLASRDASVLSCPVYVSDPLEELPPQAEAAVIEGSLALLHSPRAASLFSALVENRSRTRVAAISPAAADAAGAGWAAVHIAERPRDQALLELAAKLCKTTRPGDEHKV